MEDNQPLDSKIIEPILSVIRSLNRVAEETPQKLNRGLIQGLIYLRAPDAVYASCWLFGLATEHDMSWALTQLKEAGATEVNPGVILLQELLNSITATIPDLRDLEKSAGVAAINELIAPRLPSTSIALVFASWLYAAIIGEQEGKTSHLCTVAA
jgi:hypothetical protein